MKNVIRLLCFLALAAGADTIHTLDGSILHGKIISQKTKTVTLQTDYAGKIDVARNNIQKINTDADEKKSVVTAPASKPEPAPKASSWSYELAVNISGRSGNSRTKSSGLSIQADSKTEHDKLKLYGVINREKRDEETVTNEYLAGIDYERKINDLRSWYSRLELERDTIEELSFRSTLSAGIVRYLLKEPNHEAAIRLGFSETYEDFEEGTTEWTTSVDFGLNHMIKPEGAWQLTNEIIFRPAIDDLSDYKLYHQLKADFPLADSRNWKLRLSWRNEYDSTPETDNDKYDSIYSANLVLTWD